MSNLDSENLDPAILADLDAQDWKNDILPRALKYAAAASRGFWSLGYKVEPAELVQEAIGLVYSGRRKWNKEELPDFVTFLNGVIKSLISHTRDHSKKFPTEPLQWDDGSEKILSGGYCGHSTLGSLFSQPPDEALMEAENLKPVYDVLDELEQENEEMGLVILCVRDGISKPREIAEETGLPVEMVYKVKERLKAKMNKIMALPQKGGKKHDG